MQTKTTVNPLFPQGEPPVLKAKPAFTIENLAFYLNRPYDGMSSGGNGVYWVYYQAGPYKNFPLYLDHWNYDDIMKDWSENKESFDGLDPHRRLKSMSDSCDTLVEYGLPINANLVVMHPYSIGPRHRKMLGHSYYSDLVDLTDDERFFFTAVGGNTLWITSGIRNNVMVSTMFGWIYRDYHGNFTLVIPREYSDEENLEADRHSWDTPFDYHPMRNRGFTRLTLEANRYQNGQLGQATYMQHVQYMNQFLQLDLSDFRQCVLAQEQVGSFRYHNEEVHGDWFNFLPTT